MISHKKQHRLDLVHNGEKLFCFYQINGFDVLELSVYNQATQKIVLPADEEVAIKGKIIATHTMKNRNKS